MVVAVRRAVILVGCLLKFNGLKFVVTVLEEISIIWVFTSCIRVNVVARVLSPLGLRRLSGRARESDLIPMMTALVVVTTCCILVRSGASTRPLTLFLMAESLTRS